MNDAPLSVLLLAWDPADPTPAALNAGLAAGAALRTALAARVHLTAILPHGAPAQAAVPEAVAAAPDGEPEMPARQLPLPASPPPAAAPAPELLSSNENEARTSDQVPQPAGLLNRDLPAKAAAVSAPAPAAGSATASPATAPAARAASGEAVPAPLIAPDAAEPATTELPAPQPALNHPVIISLAGFTLPDFDAEAQRRGSPGLRAVPHHSTTPPATPYLGSSAGVPKLPLTEPAGVEHDNLASTAAEPTASAPASTAAPAARAALSTPALFKTPAAKTTAESQPRSFTAAQHQALTPESQEAAFEVEPGPAEAADLTQWEDDLTLAPADAGAAASPARAAALAALQQPASAGPADASTSQTPTTNTATRQPEPRKSDSASQEAGLAPAAAAADAAATAALSFRIIQYARFATQLVAGDHSLQVIFAADWPTWLAAVELRQRTGKPLVAYVARLPSAGAPRRARGWLQALEHQLLRHADLVLVPDADFGQELAKRQVLRQPAQTLSLSLKPASGVPTAAALAAFVAALLPALQAATTRRT